jgi:hypothetical protein
MERLFKKIESVILASEKKQVARDKRASNSTLEWKTSIRGEKHHHLTEELYFFTEALKQDLMLLKTLEENKWNDRKS